MPSPLPGPQFARRSETRKNAIPADNAVPGLQARRPQSSPCRADDHAIPDTLGSRALERVAVRDGEDGGTHRP
jgi:hypothetical protein